MKSLMDAIREGLGTAIYYCNLQSEGPSADEASTKTVEYWKDREAEYRGIIDREDLVVIPRSVLNYVVQRNVGLSEMALIQHLMGINLFSGNPKFYPKERSEFGRCLFAMSTFPELRRGLAEMATVSPEWAILVEKWSELEVDYRNRRLGRVSAISYDPRDYLKDLDRCTANGDLYDTSNPDDVD